ncbi:hypothetical protein ACFWBF_29290 [Streptomyces sp. NPDC060028]|uniref:hypothetical protein n=1 Tax=Streptomyces sp. NPDC060028 TaxID=3347041 RepID=UPI0036C39B4A
MGGWEQAEEVRHRRATARRAVPLTGLGLTALGLTALGVLLLAAAFLCARPGEARTDTAGTHAVCVSPYDLPGCGPHAHATPGVLPVPPPAVGVAGTGPAPAARPAPAGRGRPSGALARAPDLYALQVLRT